jgi:2-haloacid dehalogenase
LKVIVFDIGNVLLRWNPRNLYRSIFKDSVQMEWFLENICDGPWNESQDLGRKWIEAVAEHTSQFPEWEAEIRAYDERWEEMLAGEITQNVRVLEQLKRSQIRTFAITNFSSEKWALARTKFGFFELFDGIVVSGEVGLIKPDPRIFHLFLDRYGLVAEDCVFIDDSAANVAAARGIGMSVIHYTESGDLASGLREQGVEVFESAHHRVA